MDSIVIKGIPEGGVRHATLRVSFANTEISQVTSLLRRPVVGPGACSAGGGESVCEDQMEGRSSMVVRARSRIGMPPFLVAVMVVALMAVGLATPSVAVAATRVPTGVELVKNGKFASGVDGWRTNRPSEHVLSSSSEGRNSSKAARIAIKSTQTAVLNDVVDTLADVPAGTSFEMGVWVRSSRAGVVANVKAREVSGSKSVTHAAKVRLDNTNYKFIKLSFATTLEGSTLDLNVLFWSTEVGQSVFVDEVSLVNPVTAPPAAAPPASAPLANTCQRATPSGSMYGVSMSTGSQTGPEAIAALDKHFGLTVPTVRVFDPGVPMSWSSPRTAAMKGRDLIMSFRPMPKEILAGRHDAAIKAWFQQAPSTSRIYWSYIHEPEPLINSGAFTAADYRAAWRHIDKIADSVCRTNMYATLILTGWTTEPASKRDWRSYYAGDDVIDVMAFDPYNGVHDPGRTYYATPASIFGNPIRVAKEAGKPFAIAETGTRIVVGDAGGKGRAAWLADAGAYLRANKAVFVTYFNSTRDGHWLLDDAVSRDAWAAQMRQSKK